MDKDAKQLGLWDRIRMKRERGGTPAKPGDTDYPDAKNWKKVTGLNKKTQKQAADKPCSCGCGDTVKTCKCNSDCSCRKPGGSCYKPEKQAAKSPAWQREAGKNPEGGLNAKGRASYNKATGGNLKAPVTESNPKGERANRQNSFCARMCGMKRVNTGSKTKKDPDSRINKSLRKWNCKCSNAREFGEELSKQALGAGTGIGLVSGLLTGRKNDRLNAGLRGAVKGFGFDVGAGAGAGLGAMVGSQYGLPGIAIGGGIGGLGGAALGTLTAGHLIGPYETEEEKFKRLAAKYQNQEGEEKTDAEEFGKKIAQQRCAPGQPCAVPNPAPKPTPKYSEKPFDPAYARAALDQHKIPYNRQANDAELYRRFINAGKIPHGARRMTPFQETVGVHYGYLPPAPPQPQVSPGLTKTQAAKAAGSILPADLTKSPKPDITATQLPIKPKLNDDLHKTQDPLNFTRDFSFEGVKADPMLLPKVLPPAPVPKPPAPEAPAPEVPAPEVPAAETPAPTPAAPPPPAADKPSNMNAILAGTGLSAAGLLALYYMMQERNKPRKKRRGEEQE